ncbi:hypothetical protein ACOMHN_009497 [Nucella lapillus]
MTKRKISILGIADTGKNGTGTKEIDANDVLIWSGVSKQQRAAHGVGFIVHHDKATNLVSTKFISERLLKIGIREGNKINNYRATRSTTTFKCMHHVMTPTQMRIRTPSSKNSRTPSTASRTKKTCTSWEIAMAESEREEHRGQNTLVHTVTTEHHATTAATMYWNCAEHDLIVTNTFFQHRATHIYT